MTGARTSDYDFDLPEDRIAQTPAAKRDESRLMVVDRETGYIQHRTFRDIVDIVPSGDAIVVNTTKVFRARLLGTRDSGAPAEFLLLKSLGANNYEAMVHPGGKLFGVGINTNIVTASLEAIVSAANRVLATRG